MGFVLGALFQRTLYDVKPRRGWHALAVPKHFIPHPCQPQVEVPAGPALRAVAVPMIADSGWPLPNLLEGTSRIADARNGFSLVSEHSGHNPLGRSPCDCSVTAP